MTTVFTFIDFEALFITRRVLFVLVFLKRNFPSIWADKTIILLTIRPVFRNFDVFLYLCVVLVRRFHKESENQIEALSQHQLHIVFFTAISCDCFQHG